MIVYNCFQVAILNNCTILSNKFLFVNNNNLSLYLLKIKVAINFFFEYKIKFERFRIYKAIFSIVLTIFF